MQKKKLRILFRRKNAIVGMVILLAFVLLAALVGWISAYDPEEHEVGVPRLDPNADHWLGTDVKGRDIFTRVGYGARISISIGVACVLFSMLIGIPLGAVAGYFGGKPDMAISRILDILLSFPSILLAICIAAPMGQGMLTIIIAVGVVGVPQFARQVRASVLTLRELDFVQASRALGTRHFRILFREVLPNALGPIIVLATLGVGTAILSAAGLSFLGLGVEAGTPEWGEMLRDGFEKQSKTAYPALFSGLAISLVVLGFNLFGDGLRDALDPRSRVES